MSIRRKVRILVPLAAAAAFLAACGDDVESFPESRIDYVLPFDPGGESDITARLQQEPLQEALGVEVSISYQPGGGGALGWSELTRTSADGYTIMGHNLPHIILQPMQRDDAGYETEDLKQVYIFQQTPNMLAVRADSDIQDLDDFIAAAETGELSIGGSGDYTANHLGTLMLADMAGIELTYTPFTGTGDAVPALLGGHVDALMTYTPMVFQLGDEIRPIAVASEEPMAGLEDIPTFIEQGYEIADGAYRGVAVPPDTPDEIVDTIAGAFAEIGADPDLVAQFEEQGFLLEDRGPEEAAELTAERQQVYEELLTSLGML